MANVTPSNLTTATSTTDGTVFTTASVTIPANQVSLVAVSRFGAGSVAAPAVTQTGVTWDLVSTVTDLLWLYCAAPGSDQTGAITITFASSATACGWSVLTCANSEGGNNGADGLGTPVTQAVGTSTTATVTLATLASAESAAIGGLRLAANTAPTPGSGFTILGDAGHATPNGRITTEWQQNVTTVNFSFSSTSRCMIGVEVKAAAGGGTVHQVSASGASVSGGSAAATRLLAATATGAAISGGSVAAIIPNRQVSATGASTSGGSAAAIVPNRLVSATGASTSGGSAAATRKLAAGATGASTSGGSAAATIGGAGMHQVSASGASTSGGSASAVRRLAATATGASTSGGSATATRLLRATATGAATSGGTAAARIPIRLARATGASVSGGSAAAFIAGTRTWRWIGASSGASSLDQASSAVSGLVSGRAT